MTERHWILLFGADAMLVDTRSKVLENAGFRVAPSMTLSETERELNEKPIALLLLCHSLAPADCEMAIAAAIAINSKIPILLLSAASGPAVEKAGVAVHQMNGPQHLLKAIHELLG